MSMLTSIGYRINRSVELWHTGPAKRHGPLGEPLREHEASDNVSQPARDGGRFITEYELTTHGFAWFWERGGVGHRMDME